MCASSRHPLRPDGRSRFVSRRHFASPPDGGPQLVAASGDRQAHARGVEASTLIREGASAGGRRRASRRGCPPIRDQKLPLGSDHRGSERSGGCRGASAPSANPNRAPRSLLESDGNSRSGADIPRGSLDTMGCSDMLDRSESADSQRVFGFSANRSSRVGPRASWDALGCELGFAAAETATEDAPEATEGFEHPPAGAVGASASPTGSEFRRFVGDCIRFRPNFVSPSLDGRLVSVEWCSGGTSLAARVVQRVPRWEPKALNGEDAR